jgi:hypothetical protein
VCGATLSARAVARALRQLVAHRTFLRSAISAGRRAFGAPRRSQPATTMVKSVRKRVQELIKREGRGSQGIVSRTSGVPQSQLCQWLMGKYVAVRPALSRPVVRSVACTGWEV